MNGTELLEAMSGIDERYIDDAELQPEAARRKAYWKLILPTAAAACLALVLVGRQMLYRPVIHASVVSMESVDALYAADSEESLTFGIEQRSGSTVNEACDAVCETTVVIETVGDDSCTARLLEDDRQGAEVTLIVPEGITLTQGSCYRISYIETADDSVIEVLTADPA